MNLPSHGLFLIKGGYKNNTGENMSNAKERLKNARIKLLLSKPWYGTFASMMRWRQNENVKTMGVSISNDGMIDAWWSEKFVDSINTNEIISVIQHEIDHVIRMHVTRCRGRHREIWNFAADMLVNGTKENPNILFSENGENKCHLPDNCIWYTASKPNMTTEEVYDELKKNATQCPCGATLIDLSGNKGQGKGQPGCQGQQGQGQQGQPGQGGQGQSGGQGQGQGQPGQGQGQSGQGQGCGSGTCPACGSHPQMVDSHDTWDKSTATDEQARQIAKRHADQATQSCGNSPGHLQEAITNLKESKHDWKREFGQFLGRECGGKRMCLGRPNRRIDKFGIPGTTRRAMVDLRIMVDTSGSISSDEFQEFFGHIEKISWRAKIKMIEFDHEIQHVTKYRKGDWKKLKVHGRGGTSFVNLLDQAEERGLIGQVNIIFTDGYAPWPEEKKYPIIWVICSSSKVEPPWGKVIHAN
jgi:predicted metal-dependent peptidase